MKNYLLFAFVFITACSNPDTPVGHEGYVRKTPLFGAARFYGTQKGPASTGLGWMLSVDNVDMQWSTRSEAFDVMSSDNLNLQFHAHSVIRPKDGSIRELVEIYGGNEWYDRNVQQPFRNAVYEAVSGYKALDAKENREHIAESVKVKFLQYLHDKPFQVQAVVIGVINLPLSVAGAQEERIKKETVLSQKQFEIDIARQDAVVRIEEAKGIAEAQHIIAQSLTTAYLQHEAIKAQEKMAGSPNHSTVYIPSGTNGIPLVGVVNNERVEKEQN